MKRFRLPLFILGIVIAVFAVCWVYTSAQLCIARSKGVYATAEEGMLARIDSGYTDNRQVKFLYAGTNSFNCSHPYVWYVIAEVHASARADGSSLSKDGYDMPGLFFLETKIAGYMFPKVPSLNL